LGSQALMACHKASSNLEHRYTWKIQFIKDSNFTVIIALTNTLQLLKPTQFQPPLLKKCLYRKKRKQSDLLKVRAENMTKNIVN